MANPSKVFISYSHDSQEHKDRVLALSNRLREGGIDCQIDQYEESPAKGWPQWCADQVEESQFVLVACTETYLRRFKGREETAKGPGGTWEGHIITQELYNAQGKNDKFVPVIFSEQDGAHIPVTLQGATRYDLGAIDGYEALYRRLTAQPKIKVPPVGGVTAMPARDELPSLPRLGRKQDFLPWNVPHARNPFFTGREKVLEDLHKALKALGAAALSGLGGIGKTQTAVEYAYRYRRQYESVFWAKAESHDTLISDLVSIATLLNLPESTAKEQEVAVGAVKRRLETNTGWLLALDNADDLGMAREFIPHDAKGHILLTTRARATSAVAERVEIEEMEPEEGALFLLRRAGVIAKDEPLGAANEADRKLAEQISRELGGLPLALDQAGAFVEETPSSLAEYIELYRSEGAKLRAERGGLGNHPSVTVTFSLAFKKVAENSAAAADLIHLCAFLAPDAIPEEIFIQSGTELGENLGRAAANPLQFTLTLKEAGRFSLIDRNAAKKTLGIHRLVQAVVKDAMGHNAQRHWAERTVRAVNTVFSSPEFQAWAQCDQLLPQALACAALIEQWGFDFQEAARLLNQAGFYLKERARYDEGKPLYQRARAIREEGLGPEHPDVAQSLNNLAALYHAQSDYNQAEPLYQRALAIWEKALGPEHPDVARSLNNLAALYYAQSNYSHAEPLYQRALAIWEKALGPDHPDVARSLNNLAALYYGQSNYNQAEPLYHRALAIWERALGPDHPDVARSLNNLAELYRAQGQVRRRLSRSTSGRGPSGKRLWGRSTRTWPRASTTWQRSTALKGKYGQGRATLPAGAGDLGKGPGAGPP